MSFTIRNILLVTAGLSRVTNARSWGFPGGQGGNPWQHGGWSGEVQSSSSSAAIDSSTQIAAQDYVLVTRPGHANPSTAGGENAASQATGEAIPSSATNVAVPSTFSSVMVAVAPSSAQAQPATTASANAAQLASSSASSAPAASLSSEATAQAGAAGSYGYAGIKAGLGGFPGISGIGFTKLLPSIGWYSDYTAVTPNVGNVQGIPMVSIKCSMLDIQANGAALG